jgi:hypothetical protein
MQQDPVGDPAIGLGHLLADGSEGRLRRVLVARRREHGGHEGVRVEVAAEVQLRAGGAHESQIARIAETNSAIRGAGALYGI